MQRWLILCILFLNITLNNIYALGDLNSRNDQKKLPPCRACRTFVDSFKKGFDRTSKFKYEGGDTAWEEEKLGSYASSEIRFVEIQEKLCSEVLDGKDQCYNLMEEHDEVLEDWWFNKQTNESDLFKYLCIDKIAVCCPEFHYGNNCSPCPGYPDNICHNNGKCRGSGTRKGDGKCHCEQGYISDYCNECATNYYAAYKDEKKLLCAECHKACDGPCTMAGPTGCSKCSSGWLMDKEKGCLDINECAAPKSPCTPLQFCVNNDGGYRCLDCDRSCAGCTGDGPDMCINCASGYYKKDSVCIDAAEENRKKFVNFSRYLTYMGLSIATCIIFNKNTYLAAIVGSCVAVYITVSECMLSAAPTPKSEMGNQVAEQLMKAFN